MIIEDYDEVIFRHNRPWVVEVPDADGPLGLLREDPVAAAADDFNQSERRGLVRKILDIEARRSGSR